MAKHDLNTLIASAAWKAIRAVDSRARTCPNGTCRRRGACMVNPWAEENWTGRRGGCPITGRDEWFFIQLGLHSAMGRTLAAVDRAQRETGESFRAASERLLTDPSGAAWTRRSMMIPLRSEPLPPPPATGKSRAQHGGSERGSSAYNRLLQRSRRGVLGAQLGILRAAFRSLSSAPRRRR